MKKLNILPALVLSAALAMGLAPAAYADSTVTFKDHAGAFEFGGTEYHEADLFDGLKDAMPGDELSQKVTVKNAHGDSIDVYLKAEALGDPTYSEEAEEADGKDGGKDEESGDLLGGEGERDEDAASMADFLAQLTLKVSMGERVLFEGPAGEAGQADKAVKLGTVEPGKSVELLVELSVPAELGNEYAYRVGEVVWTFTAEELDPVLPSTGDTVPVALIAIAAAAACAAAVLLLVARRRREER